MSIAKEILDTGTGTKVAAVRLTDQPRPTRVRYGVLAWFCVATTIAYVDRGCLSVAEKLIRADLGLSEAQMGLAMSAFFLTYAVLQVPAAGLDLAWGSRRSLPMFAAAWSIATALCGAVSGSGGLLLTRLTMGAAEAGIFPAATGALGRWFPASRRAWVSGVLTSFMGVGGALGAALTGLILVVVPWRWMFLIYAVPGLLWAAGFFRWFRDWPREHSAVNTAELSLIDGESAVRTGSATSRTSPDRSPSTRVIVGLAAQQFFRAAGAIFYISWFPTYLRETRGVGVWQAGVLTSLPHWATVAGCLAGGWLSDLVLARSGRLRPARQGVAASSMLAATVLIALAYPVWDVGLAVLLLSAGAFAAALAGPCAYALTIDLGGGRTPRLMGIMNTSGAVGSIVFPSIAPWIVKLTGSWDAVLALFLGIHLAAAACWLVFDADHDTKTDFISI